MVYDECVLLLSQKKFQQTLFKKKEMHEWGVWPFGDRVLINKSVIGVVPWAAVNPTLSFCSQEAPATGPGTVPGVGGVL